MGVLSHHTLRCGSGRSLRTCACDPRVIDSFSADGARATSAGAATTGGAVTGAQVNVGGASVEFSTLGLVRHDGRT